jgi:hypothetical protein
MIWEQLKKSPWGPPTAFFYALTLMVYLLQNRGQNTHAAPPGALDWTWIPILTGVLALGWALFWFTHAFTGPVEEKRPEQVKFSYFFVIASFALLVLPPLVNNNAVGSEAMGIVSGCVKQSDSPAISCLAPVELEEKTRAENNQWLVNIGGALTPQAPCTQGDCQLGSARNRAFITGGLVVPFPLLVVALFGAAISLSRRVPEIQKQSESAYVGTAAQPALTATEAREYLTFQIMQFISAPFIAITAHQIVRPSGEAATIALAFMAGFGSETILLLIRGVAEGIKPKMADTAQAERVGTVEGVITVDGKPVSTEVTVRGTALTVTSGADGKYAIKGIPAGGQALRVQNGATPETRDVTVRAGASTPCNVDIRGDGKPPPPGLLPDVSSARASLAIAGPDTVDIRMAIDNPDLDPGTLRLFVDDKPVDIGDDGMVELTIEPNVTHYLRANAMRQGVAVSAQETATVTLDDEGSSRSLKLA